MYRLKQAGKLANDLLSKRLFAHGYYQCATAPGLWRHQWQPVTFVLIVDNFGVQYTGRQHAENLLVVLQESYKLTTDWEGTKFAGIDLKWVYNKRICRCTMDGYITKVRNQFGHLNPTKPQQSPHKYFPITYKTKARQHQPTTRRRWHQAGTRNWWMPPLLWTSG